MVSTGALRLIEDWELRGTIMDFYRYEATHDWMWERLDRRFWTVARSIQVPATNDRFFDDCAYDVHPAECDVVVPGIDAEALKAELRSAPDISGMLRSMIRDCVRAQELLTDQIARAESLMTDLQNNMVR